MFTRLCLQTRRHGLGRDWEDVVPCCWRVTLETSSPHTCPAFALGHFRGFPKRFEIFWVVYLHNDMTIIQMICIYCIHSFFCVFFWIDRKDKVGLKRRFRSRHLLTYCIFIIFILLWSFVYLIYEWLMNQSLHRYDDDSAAKDLQLAERTVRELDERNQLLIEDRIGALSCHVMSISMAFDSQELKRQSEEYRPTFRQSQLIFLFVDSQ